jgi:hypothetical protein
MIITGRTDHCGRLVEHQITGPVCLQNLAVADHHIKRPYSPLPVTFQIAIHLHAPGSQQQSQITAADLQAVAEKTVQAVVSGSHGGIIERSPEITIFDQ